MEWLEAEGDSVEDAVRAALDELGLEDRNQVDIEVLREPKKGFLGLGSQMALVKVTRKASRKRRRKRGRSGRGDSSERRESSDRSSANRGGAQKAKRGNGSSRDDRGRSRSNDGGSRSTSESRGGSQQRTRPRNKPNSEKRRSSESRRPAQEAAAVSDNKGQDREQASIDEQAEVAVDFLKGLVESFGLDANVTSRIDEDVLYLDVDGETEALVGNRGVIMHSVLELTRTVVQRKTYGAPRMRLDIAGYAARRREALTIYAGRLAEKVVEEGGEVMLEPMNPADRKVVHDAIGEIDGVRSFSEGEDPTRSVVVAAE